ncbi:MAG: MotA/TolQ/ExbB proton channel family protein [Elusimicrobiales bacterium]|nr:MotA/TolQ/ExbB proton channel family protein [Elusimicrobiales bacterium]
MDFSMMAGIASVAVLIYIGISTHQLTAALVNVHGVFMVFGGTAVSMLLGTPLRLLGQTFIRSLGLLRKSDYDSPEKLVPEIVALAEQCKLRGLSALSEANPKAGEGFLKHAADMALDFNDQQFVRRVLEEEINGRFDANNDIENVFRTMSVLAPMFGLLGTLIGIVGVLRELSNPESVGPAMAVAITSAFYGIAFANMFCVPLAGKLRMRTVMEKRTQGLVLEGLLEIMKGSIPMIVERKLQAFLV